MLNYRNKRGICPKALRSCVSVHLYVLAVSTFDIVASGWVEYRDSKILIDLLPNGATFNLHKHGHRGTPRVSLHQTRQVWPKSNYTKRSRCHGGTHIVKASQFVHQPVELEQVQVPVAQNRPFVDWSSWREEMRPRRRRHKGTVWVRNMLKA